MWLGRGLGPMLCLALAVGLSGCAASPGETPLPSEGAASSRDGRIDSLMQMGDRAAAAGDDRTAVSYYQQAAGMGASDPVALNRIGEALLRQRRWQDAADVFRRALAGGGGVAAHRGYARAMLGLDQPGPALAHLESALRLDPDDPRTLNLAGVANDMLGRSHEAQAAFRRGLELAPGDPSLANNLGLSYALAGDHAAAVAQLEPLANGPGSTARARQNLALAYGLNGDVLAAERVSRLDLDPASVRGNLAFMAALRSAADPASAASSLVTDIAVEPVRRKAAKPAADATPPAAAPQAAPIELAAATAPVDGSPGADALAMASPAGTSPNAARHVSSPAGAAVLGAPTPLAPATVAPLAAEPSLTPPDVPDLPVTPAAVALDDAAMVSGLSPIGGWLLRLGSYDSPAAAQAAWRRLRGAHAGLLGGMTRMAGSEGGKQPLLAGPLATEADADRICRALVARGEPCEKLQV